ncbi:MAG: hypothetical protein KY475_00330 [Planctomycetes bacterium]|nr:hypothetical protein [Planctomycetota bacterium]
MIASADWMREFARQADADLKAWEKYEQHPEALAAECHKMLFLQMACEKTCKAHLIQAGADPEALQKSHGYTAKQLPIVIRQQIVFAKKSIKGMEWVVRHVKLLAEEIDVLHPAVDRDGHRPDNCEYPWPAGETLRSPLDWTFQPSGLCTAKAGRTFLKLLRAAIDRILE